MTKDNYLNYENTLKEAKHKYSECDPAMVALHSGSELKNAGTLELEFLNRVYTIDTEGEISLKDSSDEVPLVVKILVLHYLVWAKGSPVQQKHISFKELPGGSIYIGPFTNRAIRPLIAAFGAEPAKLLTAGEVLGGKGAEVGDFSITLNVFPRVPVTLVLWEGDDEFPPSGNILFDVSAPDYLATEDYAVLSSFVVQQLKSINTL